MDRKKLLLAVLAGIILVTVLVFGQQQQRTRALQPTAALVSPSPTVPTLLPNDELSGIVVDLLGKPVRGATVRIQTTQIAVRTDSAGRFSFTGLTPDQAVVLTAWAAGFYISGGKDAFQPGTRDIIMTLTPHANGDNPAYTWLSAFTRAGDAGSGEDGNCENCHVDPVTNDPHLPFPEWVQDAHALSAQNPRFRSMYLGQDMQGNQSPPTKFFTNRDYGRIPIRPDAGQPYYGPGYKLDFPESNGNCAACHTPLTAVDQPYEVDASAVEGVGAEGVNCDFCHKIWDVLLDPSTGLPYPEMPGVLSFEFRRPAEGHQFFAGPYDDVAPGEDTFSPLQRESSFCAPCHYGVFWDTEVYNSFGEWLASPYSDPIRAQTAGLAEAKTCQDCHMPPGKTDRIAAADKGGLPRDPQTIFSHRMPGAADQNLLQNSVTMSSAARREGSQLVVDVSITNDQTGHHIPTDSPLRQVILRVSATDDKGNVLVLQSGPTIPTWGGVGDPAQGYYASLPGKAYAKILAERWTEVSPSGAYWNQTILVSDNRIPALGSDSSTYRFTCEPQGAVTVEVVLLFRRAFKELMDQKGWDAPDIEMERQVILVP